MSISWCLVVGLLRHSKKAIYLYSIERQLEMFLSWTQIKNTLKPCERMVTTTCRLACIRESKLRDKQSWLIERLLKIFSPRRSCTKSRNPHKRMCETIITFQLREQQNIFEVRVHAHVCVCVCAVGVRLAVTGISAKMYQHTTT